MRLTRKMMSFLFNHLIPLCNLRRPSLTPLARAALGLLLVVAPGLPIAGAAAAEPDGAALYAEHCAACHGAELEGQPDWQRPGPDGRLPAPPHDATGHTWHHGDGFLMDYTRRGGQAVLDDLGVAYDSAMPPFGDTLTDAEIAAILDYIRSHWPDEIRTFQADRTAAEDAAR
jgi:mono/diheme cytochrome c family protein